MKLCDRLRTVAELIEATSLVDIGSDHARLLRYMLRTKQIERGIAVENNKQPFLNSLHALRGLPADVRFGDGLAMLQPNEVDALSICGIGSRAMIRILDAHPDRIPDQIVLQPNTQPDLLRDWGLRRGFHLLDERIAVGFWRFETLAFCRRPNEPDPAYEGLDRDTAVLLGPWLVRRKAGDWLGDLEDQRQFLGKFARLEPTRAKRLAVIRRVLDGSES